MLRGILGFSLRFRALVLGIAIAFVVFGAVRLRNAPVDVLPEFGLPIIEVQTEALGLSAAEVEELVTLNLEELLAATPWLKTLQSRSLQGLSSILLVFEPGTDLMRARQMVHERLIMAHALPNVSKPPNMLQPVSAINRAMIVGLSSKDVSLVDMSVLARWTLTPKLLGVPGVANVAVWGMRSRQLQVQVDPQRLRDNGVTLDQIVETAGDALWVSPLSFLEASTPGAGGWIDGPNQRLGIQHVQPIKTSPRELAKVSIDGTSLSLGDVASVVEEHPPLIGDALVNNGPGLLVVIEKLPHVDAAQVVRGVEAALDELRPGLPGITIDPSIFRVTSFIETSIGNVRMALLIGAVLLALTLWLLLREWRAALISLAAIALSLVTAGLMLYLRHAVMDTMVLAGFALALAAIIDDAVIDVTNIMRRLRQDRQSSGRSTAATLLEACVQIRSPMIYATLIAVLAVMPAFLLGGSFEALIDPLVVSYVLALAASMAVALTVTPALALAFLRRAPLDQPESPVVRWLGEGYEAVLARSARAPRGMLVLAGVSALAGLAIVPMLSWSLSPSFQERDVRISWKAAPATSHPEMFQMMKQAGEELRRIPGIRNLATHIGRAVTGDQVVGIESAQMWVTIDDKADYDATLASIRNTVEEYPSFTAEVQGYLTGTLKGALTEADPAIVVRVEGPKRDELRREAERVKQVLSGIGGIVNPRIEDRDEAPHVQIEVNLAAAGRVGLKPGDVRRAVATVFAGLEVGHLFEQQKVFEVVVWGAPEVRRSVSDIRELLIPTPDDEMVRLADVAEVRVAPTPALIQREGVSRLLDVRAQVAGRDIGAVAAEVKDRLQKTQFPLEYHAVLLRDYADRQAARWRVVFAGLAAAVGIYLLLQACFQSWRLAALFCLTLLAAPVGGVLAMLLTGGTVFLGSVAGLVAILGLAARNGVLLINRFQHLEWHEGEASGPGLVLRGMREWFGPMLTSALAIVAALLPVVVMGGAAGLEIVHPIAVVMLGGVITSTLVSLLVVPALYLSVKVQQPEAQTYGREKHA